MLTPARTILRRYPGLRSTWPLKRAQEWRQKREQRLHPRRMASWFRDMPDLHTRLFVSNLEVPEAPQLCQPASLQVSVVDQDGGRLGARRFHLARNASLVVELADMLPPPARGAFASGQVIVDFEAAHLGSSRAYLHWYNERCLTSSHEKFGLAIPAVGGYWTVPNVQDSDEYRVYLAVVNLDQRPYTSSIVLKDADGQPMEAYLHLPPNGSRFVGMNELFPTAAELLGDRPGILYFGNNRQPAMYYYFVGNARLGTWRAQHL